MHHIILPLMADSLHDSLDIPFLIVSSLCILVLENLRNYLIEKGFFHCIMNWKENSIIFSLNVLLLFLIKKMII